MKIRDFENWLQDRARPPLVMGVLNVTPDSFSDGGFHLTVENAVEAAVRMVEQGADLIDVGGESTKPGSDPVSAEGQIWKEIEWTATSVCFALLPPLESASPPPPPNHRFR